MKISKSILTTLILSLSTVFLLSFRVQECPKSKPESISKKEALNLIKDIKTNCTCHIGAIKRIEVYTKHSSANYINFVVYTRKAANCGAHTMLYVKLAKETSRLKVENKLLIRLADIVELPNMGIDVFDEVLAAAVEANTDEKIALVNETIDNLLKQN